MLKKSKSKILTALILLLSMSMLFIAGCNNQSNQNGSESEQNGTQTEQQGEAKSLFVYVGANLKEPISELAEAYEQETGVKVEMTFNNSGSLLTQADTTKKGDIYIPGGIPAIEQAKGKGMIENQSAPLAYPTPVIITPKGNPAQIASVEDLANEGVELIIPDKDATAIGRSAYRIFDAIGLTEQIENNIAASVESPAKVMATVEMGQGNAGIVEFSNTLKAKDKIEVIEIDPTVNVVEQVTAASLTFSEDKELAGDFLKYLEENGPEAFAKYGFKTQKPE